MAIAAPGGFDPTTLTGGPGGALPRRDQEKIYGIDPNRGAEINGRLFGLDGPYQYNGHAGTLAGSDGTHPAPDNITLSPTTDMATAAAAITRREEGWEPVAKYDVTAYRAGYGTDTITTADGKIVKVTKGMTVTKEDAERDLQRQIPIIHAQNAKAVGPTYDKLPGVVQGVLFGVTYNYGHLPPSVRNAAASGDLKALANALEARGSDNNGIRRERYKRQADLVRSVSGTWQNG